MLGIGTLVAIACLKQPMLFQNPGTMWRDKLCVLFLKSKKHKNSVPLCVRISLFPLRFTKPPRPPFSRVPTEIFFRAYGISAALLRKFTSALTDIPLPYRPPERDKQPRFRHKVRMAWREASARLTDCHSAPVALFLQTPFPAKHLSGQQYIKTYRHG